MNYLDKTNIEYYKLTDDEIQAFIDEIENYISNSIHLIDDDLDFDSQTLVYACFDHSINLNAIKLRQALPSTMIRLAELFIKQNDVNNKCEFFDKFIKSFTFALIERENKVDSLFDSNIQPPPFPHFEREIEYIHCETTMHNLESVSDKIGFSNVYDFIIHLVLLYCPAYMMCIDKQYQTLDNILYVYRYYGSSFVNSKEYFVIRDDISVSQYFQKQLNKLKLLYS